MILFAIMRGWFGISKLLLFAFTFSNAQTGLLAGTGYAPNFTVTDINGTSHTLYNYLDSGKVVVLELLSVTCGHCQQHAAELRILILQMVQAVAM